MGNLNNLIEENLYIHHQKKDGWERDINRKNQIPEINNSLNRFIEEKEKTLQNNSLFQIIQNFCVDFNNFIDFIRKKKTNKEKTKAIFKKDDIEIFSTQEMLIEIEKKLGIAFKRFKDSDIINSTIYKSEWLTENGYAYTEPALRSRCKYLINQIEDKNKKNDEDINQLKNALEVLMNSGNIKEVNKINNLLRDYQKNAGDKIGQFLSSFLQTKDAKNFYVLPAFNAGVSFEALFSVAFNQWARKNNIQENVFAEMIGQQTYEVLMGKKDGKDFFKNFGQEGKIDILIDDIGLSLKNFTMDKDFNFIEKEIIEKDYKRYPNYIKGVSSSIFLRMLCGFFFEKEDILLNGIQFETKTINSYTSFKKAMVLESIAGIFQFRNNNSTHKSGNVQVMIFRNKTSGKIMPISVIDLYENNVKEINFNNYFLRYTKRMPFFDEPLNENNIKELYQERKKKILDSQRNSEIKLFLKNTDNLEIIYTN